MHNRRVLALRFIAPPPQALRFSAPHKPPTAALNDQHALDQASSIPPTPQKGTPPFSVSDRVLAQTSAATGPAVPSAEGKAAPEPSASQAVAEPADGVEGQVLGEEGGAQQAMHPEGEGKGDKRKGDGRVAAEKGAVAQKGKEAKGGGEGGHKGGGVTGGLVGSTPFAMPAGQTNLEQR